MKEKADSTSDVNSNLLFEIGLDKRILWRLMPRSLQFYTFHLRSISDNPYTFDVQKTHNHNIECSSIGIIKTEINFRIWICKI